MNWTEETAWEYGFMIGEQAAQVSLHSIRDWILYWTDDKDPENVPTEKLNEYVEEEAAHREQNGRQYADFINNFASEVNSLPEKDAEPLWDAYEEGVAEGIQSDRTHRLKELAKRF